MNRTLDIAAVIAAILGVVVGTFAICNAIPQQVGLFGWMLALGTLIRLVVFRRGVSLRDKPLTFAWRVLLASVATFCLVFFTAMATAGAVNRKAFGLADLKAALLFGTLAIVNAAVLVWLARNSER